LSQGADNSTIITNMRAGAGETSFEWIRSCRKKLLNKEDPSWTGNFVSRLLPDQLEACAKILHGIEANHERLEIKVDMAWGRYFPRIFLGRP
jgi:hypothetical protein